MSEVDTQFSSILLEGLFYEKEGLLMVNSDGQDQDVLAKIQPLQNLDVHLAVHHVLDKAAPASSWGQGCCKWQPSGHCPAGHHVEPHKLLVWSAAGILKVGDGWTVGDRKVPLYALPGHQARMVGLTKFDPERIGTSPPRDVGELIEQATEMRDLLQQFRDQMGKL
jgi:hypothetical protein